MSSFLVVYATREGHTRQIADHVADELRSAGHTPTVLDARLVKEPYDLTGYAAAVIAASVHAGKHEAEMVHFVRTHRIQLEALPTVFLSVSMAEATVEDDARDSDERAAAEAMVTKTIDDFLSSTMWRPTHARPVAGALLYSKYGLITRFVMKRIAKRGHHPTDTSKDYDFTDWKGLDRLVSRFATETRSAQPLAHQLQD